MTRTVWLVVRAGDGEVQRDGQRRAVLGVDGTLVIAIGGDGQHHGHVSVPVGLDVSG